MQLHRNKTDELKKGVSAVLSNLILFLMLVRKVSNKQLFCWPRPLLESEFLSPPVS